jgi:hypothetical protein
MAKSETGTADFASTCTLMSAFVLTGGGDAAVVNIREGSVSGTIKFIVKAATLVTVPLSFPEPVASASGVWFVDLVSGTTPQMTIVGD